MVRHQHVEDMRGLLTTMDKLLRRAGVPVDTLQVPANSELLPEDMLFDAHRWLLDLNENEHLKALQIWQLLPEEIWNRYAAWGDFEDHRESILLKSALRKLYKAVVNNHRPDFFKKGRFKHALKLALKSAEELRESDKQPAESSGK